MCVVISERATSAVCVCGTDRRECVCVLLLATPNTLVLDSRYPRERDWTDVRAVDLQTDDIQQLLVPKEAEVGSLHVDRARAARQPPAMRCPAPKPRTETWDAVHAFLERNPPPEAPRYSKADEPPLQPGDLAVPRAADERKKAPAQKAPAQKAPAPAPAPAAGALQDKLLYELD